jgi:NAD(P)H-hydrate epimerase
MEIVAADGPWPVTGAVIDALLGTGAAGAPRGPVGMLAARVASFGAPIIAVDGPTGLDLSTGVAHGPIRARCTVTFGGVRRGHLLARDWCGRIVVVDIGFPAPDPQWPVLADDRWARAALPPFEAAMHKGNRGRVLVVGGDQGMVGAAVHAARAALAAGAGLVKLAGSDALVAAANETLPDALTVRSALGPDVEPDLAAAVDWADALVIGPGLGRDEARDRLVRVMLATSRPAVVDADALHFGPQSWGMKAGPRVLTPHPGEYAVAFPDFAALCRDDRFAAAARAAEAAGCTVLLKGVPTVVSSPAQPSLVVAAGTPALATGGSGDVLAGFIGAFLARGVAPQVAAALGAQALGRAAELAAAELSARATRPADVIAAIPSLWKRWSSEPAITPPIVAEVDPPLLV